LRAPRRTPSPVAQHCAAAQLALQKVADITSSPQPIYIYIMCVCVCACARARIYIYI
jgi:hypothetical protein